eukprot:CAMPEP_0171318244 /NCGR_PEP_ID=MMETSP0816-20121228/86971_1 /TAXON_ID=420281 /ORGANISM="Proboscia inermis, Strain CCAP1064/1" /LENGTH=173 /DNA_ID=CAMNT_0011812501 /DNA_START=37 /DNA_END=558 /DNA_ORIENTATION=+
MFLLLVFVALILSSIPAKDDPLGQRYGTIGAWLFICSFILPFISTFCYFFEQKKIKREFSLNENDFRKVDNAVFKITKHTYDEYFKTIVDLVNDVQKQKTPEGMGYTPIKEGKSTVVRYAKESEMIRYAEESRESCTAVQKYTVNVGDTKGEDHVIVNLDQDTDIGKVDKSQD